MEIIAVATVAQLREQLPQHTHKHKHTNKQRNECEATGRAKVNDDGVWKNNKSFASKQRSGRRRRTVRLNAARATASVRISAKMEANS